MCINGIWKSIPFGFWFEKITWPIRVKHGAESDSQFLKETKVLIWEENSFYQNEQSISKWMSEVTMVRSTTCEILIESYFGDSWSMKLNSIFRDDNLHNRYVISIVKWDCSRFMMHKFFENMLPSPNRNIIIWKENSSCQNERVK